MSNPTTTAPAGAGGAPPASMFDEDKALAELQGEAAPPAEVDTSTLSAETKAEVEAGKALQAQHEAAAQAQLAAREAEAKAAAEKALADAQAALEAAKASGDGVAAVLAMEAIRENMALLEAAKIKGPVDYTSDLNVVEKEGAKAFIDAELVPDPVVVAQVRFSQVEALRSRNKKGGTIPVGMSTTPAA